jgi:hypothetical protein
MRGIKPFIINFSVVICSLVIFYASLELLTRVFWVPGKDTSSRAGVIFTKPDATLVYENITYKTNSLGLRDHHALEKGPNVIRVLTLGDSFLFGDGLAEKDLVTTNLEKVLKKNSPKIEFINGAVGGWDTTAEYENLLTLAPIYKPDIVMVFFFTNDVIDESAINWRWRIKEYLRSHSRFCAFLYYVYRDKLYKVIGAPQILLPQDYFHLDDSKKGWVRFKQATLNIKTYTLKNNMELIFVIIPTLQSLDENYPYAELREKVCKFLIDNKIKMIDLFDSFSPYNPEELWVSKINLHWNGVATKIAAKVIAEYLKNNHVLNLNR